MNKEDALIVTATLFVITLICLVISIFVIVG
jgi:hypothetical protein